jgi:hypothetical protein
VGKFWNNFRLKQVTLDTYSHVAPGLQEAAANKFDEIVLPKQQALMESD